MIYIYIYVKSIIYYESLVKHKHRRDNKIIAGVVTGFVDAEKLEYDFQKKLHFQFYKRKISQTFFWFIKKNDAR